MKHGQLAYIHALRGFAMMIIVLAHCFSFLFNELRTNHVDQEHYIMLIRIMRHINFMISYCALGVFVFISGFLFHVLSPRYDFYDYTIKKIKFVVLPYILVSIPALSIYLFDIKTEHYAFGDLSQYTKTELLTLFVFTGAALGPLWFVPMIMLFYILSPIFIRIDRTPKLYLMILPLLLLAITVGKSPLNSNPLQDLLFFLPIYLLGMVSARYRTMGITTMKDHALLMNVFWMIAMIFAYYFTEMKALTYGVIILFCYGMMGFMLQAERLQQSKMIAALADKSFGIFLIHGYLIYGMKFLLKAC
jgi:surface polysaccharide O-acyltransferase-like enzyme